MRLRRMPVPTQRQNELGTFVPKASITKIGPVAKVAKIMSDNQIRRLPILNANKHLVGIVALGDLAIATSEISVASSALSEISKPT